MAPSFLSIKTGDFVVVRSMRPMHSSEDWWIGQVIHCDGGARGPEPSLFQIACIDTGTIHTVNADLVIDRLQTSDVRRDRGDGQSRPWPQGSPLGRSAGQGS